MESNSKIYVSGHKGMVGSAIVRALKSQGFCNLLLRERSELDLLNQSGVRDFLCTETPDYIFMCAAKVGGIKTNNTLRGQFIYENLQIQNNVIHFAHEAKVKKLLFMGSSCIYPKQANQPISEQALLNGALETTNEPYAVAKIAGIKMCESYYRQYADQFFSVMPTNAYGPNDNYDMESSHVMAAVIRKILMAKAFSEQDYDWLREHLSIYEASSGSDGDNCHTVGQISSTLKHYGIEKTTNGVSVVLWGTGTPLREFIHVDDIAEGAIHCMKLNFADFYGKGLSHLNLGTGDEKSIKELAELVAEKIGFHGDIIFDKTGPDGTQRKCMDNKMINSTGWYPKISIENGVAQVADELKQGAVGSQW